MPEPEVHSEPQPPISPARQPLRGALEFITRQPGLAVTIGYALASLVGMMFSWALFNEFDIPYFQFAEITDFLLAMVREPVTFLLVLGAVPVAMLLYRWSLYTQRFYARRRHKSFIYRWLHRIDSGVGTTPVGFVFVLFAYAFLFIVIYANWKADRLMRGDTGGVSVQMTQEAGPVFEDGASDALTLLGTTARFVFLFDGTRQTTYIVPTENIAAIEFPAPAGDTPESVPAKPEDAATAEPDDPERPRENGESD